MIRRYPAAPPGISELPITHSRVARAARAITNPPVRYLAGPGFGITPRYFAPTCFPNGVGSPDLAPPNQVIETLEEASKKSDVHGYQSYTGISELREAFSKWYEKHFDVKINPANEILPLIGSKEGIMHITMAFLDPGDIVLVPDPGYPAYQTISSIAGAQVINYTLSEANNYLPDIDKLRTLDLDKVKIMWINYPHMPTGSKGNKKLFEELIDLAREHNFLICNDNPYALILNDQALSIFNIEGARSHCLELCSLSKHYNMPGWRIGAVVGQEQYIQNILRFKSNMDSGMFKPIQLAGVTAMEQDLNWFKNLNQIYRERKQSIELLMDELGCTYKQNQAGMFVWAKVGSDYLNGKALSDKLLYDHHVFITPGFIFGQQGDQYVRASICQPMSKIKEAIERCR